MTKLYKKRIAIILLLSVSLIFPSCSSAVGAGGGLLLGVIHEGVYEDCIKKGQSRGTASSKGKVTEIDGVEIKLPIDWGIATQEMGESYNGANWTGDDSLRGIGMFNTTETIDNDPAGPIYDKCYSVNIRQEYVLTEWDKGRYKTHALYKGKVPDREDVTVGGLDWFVTGHPTNPDVDSNAVYNAFCKAKVIVYNRAENKACVCSFGFNVDADLGRWNGNLNWGGAPLALMGGFTLAVRDSLTDGDPGKLQPHPGDDNVVFELFFTDPDTPVGPCDFNGATISGGGTVAKSRDKDFKEGQYKKYTTTDPEKRGLIDTLSHGNLPKEKVQYIMMHDTEGSMSATGQSTTDMWISQGKGVGAHFVVDRDGTITEVVPMSKIAHHAGYASVGSNEAFNIDPNEEQRDDKRGSGEPNGGNMNDYGMNSVSIGIEIQHNKNEGDYPQVQLEALDRLVAHIDDYLGSMPEIIDHKEWTGFAQATRTKKLGQGKEDCSANFPLESYKVTRSYKGGATQKLKKKIREQCDSGTVFNGDFAQFVAAAAYEPGQEGKLEKNPSGFPWTNCFKEIYERVKKDKGAGPCNGADCGNAVATFVIGLGLDTDYPISYTLRQENYCRSSDKWEIVVDGRKGERPEESKLQPGDIFIVNEGSGAGAKGHTYIYVGKEIINGISPGLGEKYNAVTASLGDNTPRFTTMISSDGRGSYSVFRAKNQEVEPLDNYPSCKK